MSKLTEKLVTVQSKLKAPKGQMNKFGGYAYRSCEDILEAVKPLLAEQGLALVISDEMVEVGGRVYVKAVAAISDGEDSLENTAYARESETKKGMDESQITGAASSYARKYALNGLFLIDDTKDADATNDHGKSAPKSSPVKSKETAKNSPGKPAEKSAKVAGKAPANAATKPKAGNFRKSARTDDGL